MDLRTALIWMVVGSFVLGLLFNGMNVLAFRFNDLFLSTTLVLSALLMAFLMGGLEILMHASQNPTQKAASLFVIFVALALISATALRRQWFVDDKQWLKRMISHHSTALTTSHRIRAKTANPQVASLADAIIDTQEKEIKEMKILLQTAT